MKQMLQQQQQAEKQPQQHGQQYPHQTGAAARQREPIATEKEAGQNGCRQGCLETACGCQKGPGERKKEQGKGKEEGEEEGQEEGGKEEKEVAIVDDDQSTDWEPDEDDEEDCEPDEDWTDLLEDLVDHSVAARAMQQKLHQRKKALRNKLRYKVLHGDATPTECGLYRLEKKIHKKALRKLDPCFNQQTPHIVRRSSRGKNARSYGHMRLRQLNK